MTSSTAPLSRIIAPLAALLISMAAAALPPSRSCDALAIKADRFFDQKEWASASAMYELMLEQRPDSAALYGRAVTAEGMRGDSVAQIMLLRRALAAKVPIDSLFASVEQASFALGQANLLEQFLKMSARAEPWLARKIDASLLDYYAFRRDGASMIHYAGKLLAGVPDNEHFGILLAEGLLIEGRDNEARQAFGRVLDSHPASLTPLLYLGEMAAERGDTTEAIAFLTRARAIAPSPRLDATLSRLAPPGTFPDKK